MKPEATNPGKELVLLVEMGVPDCRGVREASGGTECVIYIIYTYEIVDELT